MAEISAEQRALIKSQIEDLVTAYGYLFDHKRAEEMAALFTEDCHFNGVAGEVRGREALGKLFVKQAAHVTATRHVTTNLWLEIQDESHATGTSTITAYAHVGEGRGKPKPHLVGDYVDTYERGADGKWRFASRRVDTVFSIGK